MFPNLPSLLFRFRFRFRFRISGFSIRPTLILYKSSLKEKLHVIQGLDKEILDLSTEEEIVSKIEETDQFCSQVELVLARLAKHWPPLLQKR